MWESFTAGVDAGALRFPAMLLGVVVLARWRPWRYLARWGRHG